MMVGLGSGSRGHGSWVTRGLGIPVNLISGFLALPLPLPPIPPKKPRRVISDCQLLLLLPHHYSYFISLLIILAPICCSRCFVTVSVVPTPRGYLYSQLEILIQSVCETNFVEVLNLCINC